MTAIHIILGAPKEEPIQPLMKDEGIVIGVDRGSLFALEEGIQVDVAVGDFDSITKEEHEMVKNQIQNVLKYPSEKEDTDTEIAFLYVLENYSESNIYLYNWYGGRIDHLYSILLIVLQERFEELVPRLHFVSTKNQISYYLPGEYSIDKMEAMDYLSYILLTEVENLTLNDVKYPLTNRSFERPLALISNEFIQKQASFSFSKGIIAVIQSRD